MDARKTVFYLINLAKSKGGNRDICFKKLTSKTSRQTLYLFSAQIFGMVIGFISSMLLARAMGAHMFGIYSFALAIISFGAIFFEFGYFASTARLLAVNHDKQEEREIIGSSTVIVGLISISFFVFVFIISFFVDNIFEDKVGYIIRVASVVSWSFILPYFMGLILKGSNHIEYLSGFNIIWKLLFVVSLLGLYVLGILTPLNVLVWLSLTCIIPFLFFIKKLQPSFENLKITISKIHAENKTYGIHLYTGRVVDTASYQLDRLIIGFFVGAKDVGFYSLANSMATPINSFSSALSSSKFKSFADGRAITNRVLKLNLGWIILSVSGANILGYIIINYYLGCEYQDVFLLLVFMSLAVGFQAAYQPYNAWLGTNGFGKYLKRKAIYTAFLNVILNFALIPFWGALGAVVASMLSMFFSYILHMRYYHLGLKNEASLS